MWHVRVSFQKPAALCICHTHTHTKLTTIKPCHAAAVAGGGAEGDVAKFVLKYFVANMRAKLKIMQRIKNLTSAYPLSATRLACSAAQCCKVWQARGGLVCGVQSRKCGERQRRDRERGEAQGRQAGNTRVRCLLPASFDILIFDIYYAEGREREIEGGTGRGGMNDKHSGWGVSLATSNVASTQIGQK